MGIQLRAMALVQMRPVRWAILTLSLLLALAGLRRLLLGLYFVSDKAGYDFRFFWLAGRLWLEGQNPYGGDYASAGAVLIPEGHVPDIWVYPPSWWPFSSALALTDIGSANLLWNIAGVALCLAASFLVTSAFRWAYSDVASKQPMRDLLIAAGMALPLLHFFGTAELEATSLVIGVGQSSIFIYFGVAVLLFGIAKDSRPICAIGLTLIFLKPQIGLPFAALFLAYSRWSRQTLAWALALSAILSLPALISEPRTPLDMIRNISGYDDLVADLPQAMTGLRFIFWHAFGLDIGSFALGLVAALAAFGCGLALKRLHPGEQERRLLWLCATVTTAITLALGPLHFYDFVLMACLLPATLVSGPPYATATLLGVALIVRADTLGKVTGLYDPMVAIFEGSLLATAGALLLLVSAFGAARPASFGRRAEVTRPT